MSKKSQPSDGFRSYHIPRVVALGNVLRSELRAAASSEPVRHLVIQDHDGVVGILLDVDEFNVLMRLAALLDNPAVVKKLTQEPKESTKENLSFDDLFVPTEHV